MDIHQAHLHHHHNAPILGEQEIVEQDLNIPPLNITSFTEIPNLCKVKIMLFQAMEDKKFVCKCPMVLYKCSLDIRAPLNEAVGKFAIILSPSVKGVLIPQSMSQLSVTPSTQQHRSMSRLPSFIIWNIRDGNNDELKCHFRDLINTHNPCMVALFETRMSNHISTRDEFQFSKMVKIPTHGQYGGIAILWHDNIVQLSHIRLDG